MIGYGVVCRSHSGRATGRASGYTGGRTFTSVDFNSGIVELNLLVTPDGVTDGK